MGARIPIRVRPLLPAATATGALDSAGLDNTGYEPRAVEIVLPPRAAERLGYWPDPPEGAQRETYLAAAGGKFDVVRIPAGAEIHVVTPDRIEGPVRGDVVVVEGEIEILLGSTLASRLKIVTLDPEKGIWAFRDELDRPRTSAPPVYW